LLGLSGSGVDFLLTNQVQSNLATASSSSRSEQKKDRVITVITRAERGEKVKGVLLLSCSVINHRVSVKTLLCAKSKKLLNEKKIYLHYALSASSAKDGCTPSSRTPIHHGESSHL